MKTLFLVLLILLLVVTAGKLVYSEPGLLTISYPGWIVETTPAAVLIISTVAIICLLVALKLLSMLLGMPGFFSDRSQSGRRTRARRRLVKGFIEFTEGRWQQAEKQLSSFDKDNETALINCLTAARAAHFQGEYERRDNYLEQAAGLSQSNSPAIDITRAELQIDQQDYDSALETLAFLRSSMPRNSMVIKLVASVYWSVQDWSKLDALLPVVRRYKAMTAEGIESLERACWQGMIKTGEGARMARYWQRLPAHAQNSPELLSLFVTRMIVEGKHEIAETMLREHLDRDWSDDLVAVYARIELDDAPRQLDFAERWVGKHGRSAALLLTLGQLCLRCQLWGKARVYLESSLGIQDSAHASLVLAELLTQLGETDNARNYYANGLRLALDREPGSGTVLTVPELKSKSDDDEPPATTATGDLKLVEKQA